MLGVSEDSVSAMFLTCLRHSLFPGNDFDAVDVTISIRAINAYLRTRVGQLTTVYIHSEIRASERFTVLLECDRGTQASSIDVPPIPSPLPLPLVGNPSGTYGYA